MERTINEILEDLKRLDPHFDVNDLELRKMVADLVALKPDTRLDEHFVARLRAELIKEQPVESPYQSYISFFNTKMLSGATGALIAILLVAPLTYVLTKRNIDQSPESLVKNISSGLSLKQQINTKEGNAFGTLSHVTVQANAVASDVSQKTIAPQAMSMSAPLQDTAPLQASGVFYTGADIKLTDTQGKVYRRVKGIDAGRQLAAFLKNANFDVVNMGTFGNLALQTLELSEDEAYGHTLGINFTDGLISIYPNNQWAKDSTTAMLKTSDVPTDTKLIEIANTFVKEHGIDVSGYGKPVVQGKQAQGIPEFLSVTYPLIIDGLEVYEESGIAYGMHVVVDIREKKISSVQNLTSQLYDSSAYTLETDSAKLIKVATGGGTAKNGIELSTPRKVLMRTFASDVSGELYVPALFFPAKGKGGSSSGAIVIPLVKDALNKISVSSDSTPDPAQTENSNSH